jgi:hypothetical protein
MEGQQLKIERKNKRNVNQKDHGNQPTNNLLPYKRVGEVQKMINKRYHLQSP